MRTPHGTVEADHVLLATGAYKPATRAVRRLVAPVYDYVLVTEPLDDEQRAALRWRNGQGIADRGNQFHYYRLTPDGRLLFGGYEAIYHFGNRVDDRLNRRPRTFELLARHVHETFPALEGIRFTHAWGGPIDTCSRFCVTFGRALGGKAVYAVGYTGLGVGASRFGARTALDMLDGHDSIRTRTKLGALAPAAVPARAAALRGDRGDPQGARPRGRAWRPARPVAAAARPPRARLRQLSYSPRCGLDARLVTFTEKRDGCSRTSGLSMSPRRSISLIHWLGRRTASICFFAARDWP